MPRRNAVRQRHLASSAKVPIKLSPYGLLHVDAAVGGSVRSLLLDTSFSGVLYKCETHSDCPMQCTDAGVSIMYPNGRAACVDKVTTDLRLGESVSVPSVTVGRIPQAGSIFFGEFTNTAAVVDGVLGLGLPEFSTSEITELEGIDGNVATKWSTYSIYVPPVGKDNDAFLSVGGINEGPISASGLTGYTYTALNNQGYRLQISDFILDGTRAKTVSCTLPSDCVAVLNSASPIISVPETTWEEINEYLKTHTNDCYVDYYGDEYLNICSTQDHLPDIGFTLGEQTFFLKKEHYTAPMPGKPDKVAVLLSYDVFNKSRFSFGVPFFRAFSTAFDTPSRNVTFHCKDGVTCIKSYKPLGEPAHAVIKPRRPTEDNKVAVHPRFYKPHYVSIEVGTTSGGVALAHLIGVVVTIAGAVFVVALVALGPCRQRRMRKTSLSKHAH